MGDACRALRVALVQLFGAHRRISTELGQFGTRQQCSYIGVAQPVQHLRLRPARRHRLERSAILAGDRRHHQRRDLSLLPKHQFAPSRPTVPTVGAPLPRNLARGAIRGAPSPTRREPLAASRQLPYRPAAHALEASPKRPLVQQVR